MDNEESEFTFLNAILKDFLSNFCHCCIETICNEALKSIYRLQIEPEKMVSCYLMFLREKILNTEIECKFKPLGCKDRIMFGELRHHLLECKYNTKVKTLNTKMSEEKLEIPNFHNDIISYNDLTISSSSASIINNFNESNKNVTGSNSSNKSNKSNKKKKNKK